MRETYWRTSSTENGGRKVRSKYENRAENGSVFYLMTVSFAVFAIFAGVFPLLFGLFGLVGCDDPFLMKN